LLPQFGEDDVAAKIGFAQDRPVRQTHRPYPVACKILIPAEIVMVLPGIVMNRAVEFERHPLRFEEIVEQTETAGIKVNALALIISVLGKAHIPEDFLKAILGSRGIRKALGAACESNLLNVSVRP
jgi:hypothetical protein